MENNDYLQIAIWGSYPEVRRHLRSSIAQIQKDTDLPIALRDADRYFHNKNRQDEEGNYIDDDPNKIIPIVAVNGLDEPIASLVIRLKGDPFANSSEEIKAEQKIQDGNIKGEARKISRVAGIESIVVDPKMHHMHFGTSLMTAALDMLFSNKVYDGESATAVRLWVFNDKIAGDYTPNMNFVRDLGFEVLGTSEGGTWREYAVKRGIPNPENRDGQQYELKKEIWETRKREDAERKPEDGGPRLMLPSDIIDEATLRISHASAESN
jgi:ribosomal protein S18 acetylase RimI-like enzyme